MSIGMLPFFAILFRMILIILMNIGIFNVYFVEVIGFIFLYSIIEKILIKKNFINFFFQQ